jgi:acyl-CoA thioesterase-1
VASFRVSVRVVLLALLAVVAALPQDADAATPLVYAALGDSTGVGVGAEQGGGYPERLARRLEASGVAVKLQNLSVSGATAADLRRTQLPRVLAERPALVTIGIGINDAIAGRPQADFARVLEVVADSVVRTQAAVVISELPDLSSAPALLAQRASLARRVAAYNAVIRRVADRHGIAVADLETTSRRAFQASTGLFSRDGFHPSARGYDLWADAMWPVVERAVAPRIQARRRARASTPAR